MYSRKILDRNKDLILLIDSISVNSLLSKKDLKTQKLLSYVGRKPFIFLKFPLKIKTNYLDSIPEFLIKHDDDNNMKIINYKIGNSEVKLFFRLKMEDIINRTKDILKKENLKDSEIELAKLIYTSRY